MEFRYLNYRLVYPHAFPGNGMHDTYQIQFKANGFRGTQQVLFTHGEWYPGCHHSFVFLWTHVIHDERRDPLTIIPGRPENILGFFPKRWKSRDLLRPLSPKKRMPE